MTEITNEDIISVYKALAAIPAVSGKEEIYARKIREAVFSQTNFFESCEILSCGGLIFRHSCGKPNAKKLLFDAHLDTVGFAVTEILSDGFLRVCQVGGIDKRLLFASEVEIYGKRTIKGVFVSTPPHLKKTGEKSDKLPPLSEMYIDTGFSEETLRSIVSVGDACGFVFSPSELLNNTVCGRSMDDRICAAAVIATARLIESDKNYPDNCDIIFSFSSAEEINGSGGAAIGRLLADGAVVLDVNFGRDKTISEKESYVLGKGCGVSYSCTTSRALTDELVNCAQSCGIACQTMVEPANTGTNAHYLANAYIGTPCAVLSIPEKYMHQANEAVCTDDVISCAKLLKAFAKDFPNIAEKLETARIVKPFAEICENGGKAKGGNRR